MGYWSSVQMNLLSALLVNDTQLLTPHAQDNKRAILAKQREIKLAHSTLLLITLLNI